MKIFRNRDVQFPVAVELNSGVNKLTIDAAIELHNKLRNMLIELGCAGGKNAKYCEILGNFYKVKKLKQKQPHKPEE